VPYLDTPDSPAIYKLLRMSLSLLVIGTPDKMPDYELTGTTKQPEMVDAQWHRWGGPRDHE